MKNQLIYTFVLSIFAISCSKQISNMPTQEKIEYSKNNIQATTIKDCTGEYIRYDGKDYHICNTEKTSTIESGATVQVSFDKIDVCTGTASTGIVCMMYHENVGWINIKSIK